MTHLESKMSASIAASMARRGEPIDLIAECLETSEIGVKNWLWQKGVSIPRKPGARFADVDWTLQDTVLAREHGVSREYMRQIRLKLGKPRAVKHHKLTVGVPHPVRDRALKWLAENRHLDGKISRPAAAKAAGVSETSIRRAAAAACFHWKPPTDIPYKRMNFDLPSTILARIWGVETCPSQANPGLQITTYRRRHGKGRAKWDLRGMRREAYLLATDPAFAEAVRAEREKAGAFQKYSTAFLAQ